MANSTVEVPLSLRVPQIRVRAIGGKVLVGDVLFLKALQGYVDYRLPYYQKMNQAASNVIARLEKEFPVEFGHQQPVKPPAEAFEEAKKDFAQPGFKTLIPGMEFSEFPSGYTILFDERFFGRKTLSMTDKRWLSIGPYPLKKVTAYFYDNRLYQISIAFEQNGTEIFKLFQDRFGHLSESKTDGMTHTDWMRDSIHLVAKVPDSPGMEGTAAILGTPANGEGTTVTWDEIRIYDPASYKGPKR